MRWLLLLLLTLTVAFGSQAANPPTAFVPNQGQWPGPHLFQVDLGNASCFFLESEVRMALFDPGAWHEAYHHRSETGDQTLDLVGLQLDFPGSKRVMPLAHGPKSRAPFTYFRAELAVSSYPTSALLYPGLYEGIDLLWKAGQAQLKYDFIVAPGADPSQIRVRYRGGERVELADGRLRVRTALGHWYEEAPVAWQGEGRNKTMVPCHFKLDGETIRFVFPKGYDRTQPLVIDPTLVFSTYSGSTSNNFGFTACPDEAANMYTGGVVFGPFFPVTPGAYQTNFNGLSIDIGLLKFDPTGSNLLYATFLGGSQDERPHSLIANANGELFIMGSTVSANFPVTPNAFDNTHNGGSDIFISKLSADGTQLLASTFFGGSGNDGLNLDGALRQTYADEYRGDILLASNGDVLVASMVTSSGLATTGVFQPNYGGGGQDGLVLRLSPNLNALRWCSYVGGNGSDALYAVKEGISGEVLVAGGSNSADLSLPGLGFQTSPAGGVDGILLRLEALTGVGITGTFLGSAGYDQLFFIDIDGTGSVYANGQTDSNLVTINTNYNDPRSGQFIANFSNQLGTLNWLGRYGTRSGQPELALSAFVVDLCQNIYVSGWTGIRGATIPGPTNLQLTNNAFQTSSDGFDFYLAAFSPGMLTLQYSTYFGGPISGEHVDGGTSRFDKRGVMYQAICAGCQGNSDLPITPNAYATSNGSVNCNNAAIKLAFQLESGLGANFGWNNPPTYCAPVTLDLYDDSRTVANTSWLWTTSNGDTSTLTNPQFSFPEPGTYSISLRISSPSACNGFDTLTRVVTIHPQPVLQLPADTCICEEDGYELRSNLVGSSYVWSGAVSSTESSIRPTQTGTYILDFTDNNGCTDRDTSEIIVIKCFGEVPNVITPNGDGINDRMKLAGTDFESFEMRVFNRWGQEVFATNNQVLGWGGEGPAGPVKAGNYFVRIKATYCGNRLIEREFPVMVSYAP